MSCIFQKIKIHKSGLENNSYLFVTFYVELEEGFSNVYRFGGYFYIDTLSDLGITATSRIITRYKTAASESNFENEYIFVNSELIKMNVAGLWSFT